ncbi:MAG: hypothetical protein KatS3mg055_1660 [Chloroflexus sp.]|nr:MAG: hypothetical protein KatS3mg055_1660 [Chloroflexus sp.]
MPCPNPPRRPDVTINDTMHVMGHDPEIQPHIRTDLRLGTAPNVIINDATHVMGHNPARQPHIQTDLCRGTACRAPTHRVAPRHYQ